MKEYSILPYQGKMPKIADDVFIAAGSRIIGDVAIGAGSSIWFNCVLRGDVEAITIGNGTNIQDGTVIHVTNGQYGAHIGNDVLVGHLVLLHGCRIGDGAMIGMRATLMDGVEVEAGAIVAAGSLVTPGKQIQSGELWAGSPARKVRDLTEGDRKMLAYGAPHYQELAQIYRREQERT